MECLSYPDTVRWLFSRHRSLGIRLGLERMKRACRSLHNPEKSLRCLHVAGTNGKGSVCTKLSKAYELSGCVTGLFTSPHISSFRERFQLNGECISEKEVVEGVAAIRRVCSEELTFFESTMLLALLWFRKKGAEMVVFETGLGGRLDATNICHPDLCVITSVSLDHMDYLGTTLEQIAAEKAGIIKDGIPVVIGPRIPHDVVYRKAQQHRAPLLPVCGTFADYDEENSAIARQALSCLDIPSPLIDQAVGVRPPCRFQRVPDAVIGTRWSRVPPAVVLDVAHNPDGMQRLIMKAKASFPHRRFCFLLAVSQDKDVQEMISSLQGVAEMIVCTESQSPRAMPACMLAAIVREKIGDVQVLEASDSSEALVAALQGASVLQLPLFVTGTFFFMSAIRQNLGFDDVVDDSRLIS